jgi:hypothetical protein
MKANAPKKNGELDFVLRAERAFRRVAKKVRAEHKRRGTKPLVWSDKN